MGADAGNRRVIDVNNGMERMRLPEKLFEGALSSDACQAHGGVSHA